MEVNVKRSREREREREWRTMKIIKLPIFALIEFLVPNIPAPADRKEIHAVTPQIDMQRVWWCCG